MKLVKTNNHRMRFGLRAALLVGLFAVTSAEKCGELVSDPGFQDWDASGLASWTLEKGAIRQVGSWHARDYAVEFVGDDVAISQRVDFGGRTCVEFDVVADVDEMSQFFIEIDHFDDGTLDHEERVPATAWGPIVFQVSMPVQNGQGSRLRLRKQGSGRAVVGLISIIAAECEAEDMLSPIGSVCVPEAGVVCASDLECATAQPNRFPVCGECSTTADCTGGQVCGLAPAPTWALQDYPSCVEPAGRGWGEQCRVSAECDSGLCRDGACAGCDSFDDCPDGQLCRAPNGLEYSDVWSSPKMCLGSGETGGGCVRDGDCDSGTCAGTHELRVCPADGRRCETDDDCPNDIAVNDGSPLCWTVGVAAGTCQ